MIIENNNEEMKGKRVKISLKSGFYYKGLVLSEGDEWIKIRDVRNNIVFILLENISVIEEVSK